MNNNNYIKQLEEYLSSVDKALGLIDNSDDVELSKDIIKRKNKLYILIDEYMDAIQDEIIILEQESASVRDF